MGLNYRPAFTSRRKDGADDWERTIVSFQSPYSLRDMCIPQPEDALLRNGSVEHQKFKIRLAHSDERVASASMLVQRLYASRGYENTAVQKAPNRVTLMAFQGDAVIGTLTVGFDRPGGLMVDELYKDQIDQLRQRGARICELTKLAIDQSVKSKHALAALFHIAYIYGRNIHQGTDFVIEVNPRHALFYKKMLGFEDWGDERMCPRVNALAVLLRLDLAHAEAEISRLGGLAHNNEPVRERSLYPYFFSKKDETGITGRLLRGE